MKKTKSLTAVKNGTVKPAKGLLRDNKLNSFNIKDKSKAEKSLAESEGKYRSLFEAMSEMVAVHEIVKDSTGKVIDYRILDVNPTYTSITGISSKKAIGALASELYGTGKAPYLDIYAKVAGTGKPVTFETFFQNLGKNFSISVFSPQPGLFVTVTRDITEFILTEKALRESEEKFKYIFDNSVIGKSITLPSGEIQVNKAFCEMLGYSTIELIRKKWQDISHPADIDLTQKEIDTLLSGKKETARFTKRYISKNGNVVWAEVSSSLRRDGEGKPLYFMTSIVDITKNKNEEAALQKSESSLQAILRSTADGILAVDSENKVLFASDRFAELWRIPKKVMLSKEDSVLLQFVLDQLSDPQAFLKKVSELYHSDKDSFDLLTFKDGRVFERFSRPLMQWTELRGRVWSFRDITKRRQAEETIRVSETRYRNLIDSQSDIIARSDPTGKLTFVNNAYCHVFGKTSAELVGKNFAPTVLADDLHITLEAR
jgi:PAS domain S-box-containing protein